MGLSASGRSHTTRVLGEFRSRGLIETWRGSMLLRDQADLKNVACRWVKNHFDEVLSGVYPDGGN